MDAVGALWDLDHKYDTKEGKANYVKDALGKDMTFMYANVQLNELTGSKASHFLTTYCI